MMLALEFGGNMVHGIDLGLAWVRCKRAAYDRGFHLRKTRNWSHLRADGMLDDPQIQWKFEGCLQAYLPSQFDSKCRDRLK
jgi:hypothetical protein